MFSQAETALWELNEKEGGGRQLPFQMGEISICFVCSFERLNASKKRKKHTHHDTHTHRQRDYETGRQDDLLNQTAHSSDNAFKEGKDQ